MAVYFNGRSAVHAGSQGVLTTTSVNYTGSQRQQVSYTNTAKSEDSTNTATNVFVDGNPVCHKDSYFSKSTGDEQSDGGGVNSGTVNGQADFTTWSSNIFINGIPVVRNGDMMVSNNKNTNPAALQQPGYENPMAKYLSRQYANPVVPTPFQIQFDVGGFNAYELAELLHCRETNGALIQEIAAAKGNSTDRQTRRLTFPNLQPGDKYLHYEIPSSSGAPIQIPIGKITPVSKDAIAPAVGQGAHALVPVKLCWSTFPDGVSLQPASGDLSDLAWFSDQDRANILKQLQQATAQDLQSKTWTSLINSDLLSTLQQEYKPQYNELLRPGWVYIYINGYLWREAQVSSKNNTPQYSEVDLSTQAGKDFRSATGTKTPMILLLARFNNQPTTIEIAYSDTQWSWPRVNYFGGMDPSDIRIKQLNLMPPTNNGGENARQ